jgi:diguanylate cyclase
LHYQPQYDAFSGEVVATEALVRWQHPERGLMLPSQFIHVAEESGLIEPIGEWVLGEACRQNRAWQASGLRRVPVSVNLSAAELHRAATVRMVEQALKASGLDARWLELEVTESMLMRDVEHVRTVLQQMRDMGVLIALDDFGTGYSSLAHLRRFPLSALKVDRSFVRDIETDANDAAICRAIIALGKTLGLRVIAEGVENGAQLEFLRSNHCDAVQGSLFSWGVPAEEMAVFLQPDTAPLRVADDAVL